MIIHTVQDYGGTNALSKDEHFNANILTYAHTGETPWGGNNGNPLGSPTNEIISALSELEVEFTRFPAGQEKESFSNHGIVVNGQLSSFLDEYLSYAHENGLKVSLVVPVESLEVFGGVGTPELYDQLATMAQLIGEHYPGTVAFYELGNEYWIGRDPEDESREIDYGIGAAHAALSLQSGILESEDNSKILLQASGNLLGSYGNSISSANEAIQNSFAQIADPANLVDGIIRNFYWRDADTGGFQNDSGIFREDRGLKENFEGGDDASWEQWTGTELLRVVGEFNINRNIAIGDDEIDIGIHGASFILEHFTNLIEADVDYAFAWPIIHSTQNAYIDRHEDILIETVHGNDVIVNSTRAAMFDILGDVTVGLELIDVGWTDVESSTSLEVTLFKSISQPAELDQRSEIFLSSRSAEASFFTVDLSSILSNDAQSRAYIIGYAPYGGNHRNAELREVDLSSTLNNGILEVYLAPYEVFHLTSVVAASDRPVSTIQTLNGVSGTDEADFLLGLESADHMTGLDGDDILIGEGGHDVVDGGNGNDTLLGSAGDDQIMGGFGDDVIDGGDGGDIMFGGDGADTILGYAGRDSLEGDAGGDFLVGGEGQDTLIGGAGDDRMHGQEDDDLLSGGTGNDTLFGDDGNDFLEGGSGEDLLIGGGNSDTLLGGDGADELIGDWGFDALNGGAGNDILNGGAGADILTGGAGSDLFYFDSFDGRLDRITDFNTGEDQLVFNTSGFGGEYQGVAFFAYDGGSSSIVRFIGSDGVADRTLGGIILEEVMASSLSEADYFIF